MRDSALSVLARVLLALAVLDALGEPIEGSFDREMRRVECRNGFDFILALHARRVEHAGAAHRVADQRDALLIDAYADPIAGAHEVLDG